MDVVETLVTEMERHRDRLVLIVAGHPDDLEPWDRSHPGLASRFAPPVEFPPYTTAELLEILRRAAAADGYDVLPEAADRAARWLEARRAAHPSDFGNALAVRELLGRMESRMARRLATSTPTSVAAFVAEDVPT
jgi:Cdc6-like AAA superfamily ATPase